MSNGGARGNQSETVVATDYLRLGEHAELLDTLFLHFSFYPTSQDIICDGTV